MSKLRSGQLFVPLSFAFAVLATIATASWFVRLPTPGERDLPSGAIIMTEHRDAPPGFSATGLSQTFGAGAWASIPSMPTPRSRLAVTEANGVLYAVGGQSGGQPVGILEAYDPASNQWIVLSPMPTPRWSLAAAAAHGRIYAMGGVGLSGVEDRVEVYDPATDM